MKALLLLTLLLGGRNLSAALPATDAFGYNATSIAYGWTDISGTGTPINLGDWSPNGDDGSVQVDLPFNFSFYGSSYAKFYLSSNGYIQFGSASSHYAPNCLNLNVAPLNIAAAYWMDLDPTQGGTVHKEVLGLAPNRSMVLQFTNIKPRLGSGSLSFQIVVDEGHSIRFFYNSTSTHDGGASAVAGLRAAFDCPNRQGLPVSCLQAVLGDSSAVRFAYPAVEPVCGTPTHTATVTISPSHTLSHTRTFTPTVTPTFTPSPTASPTSTITETSTVTPSFSASPSATPTGTISPTFSASPSATESFTASPSSSTTPTQTPSFSASPSFSDTATITETSTASPSFSVSPTATETATETATASISPTLSASASVTATPTDSATETGTQSSTPSPSSTDSPTLTVSVTPTVTPTSSATGTGTISPTHTPSPTFTPTLLPAASKPACLVMGQASFNANTSGAASASSVNGPLAVALDTRSTPFRVYVADTGNHRVLYWNDGSQLALNQPADGVLGQPDFNSAVANNGGLSAATLNSPSGLAVDPLTGAVWVSDTGNHRLLRFSLPLAVSATAADRVLGQGGSFTSNSPNNGGISAASLSAPAGISSDAFGALAVADSGNHRVLRFSSPASNPNADMTWGQGGSFNSGSANLSGVNAYGLNAPLAALLLADQLWVADSGNHRVLRYSLQLPLTQTAGVLLGQPGYASNSPNRGLPTASDERFNGPRSLAVDLSGRLLVADGGNHRVIAFEPPYALPAALVWGQSNLGLSSAAVGNDRMNAPAGLASNGSSLVVADAGNHRVIAYGCGAGLQALTATPTFTPTATNTPSFSATETRTATPTFSTSPTLSPSFSASPSYSVSSTFTHSPTRTISFTRTPTPTISSVYTASSTPSPSQTPSITLTLTYTQTAPPTPTPAPFAKDEIFPYPNPVTRLSGRACFAFPRASSARVEIFDFLSQPVARLEAGQIQASAGTACWNLRTSDGGPAVAGEYQVRIVSDGQARTTKFTLQ